ncbi:hypothetical protein P0L94_10415 [Microbacter sp. GSS18]|nr:hypothetical protein P0L94_10415 [Microbacter sp. GSS18]
MSTLDELAMQKARADAEAAEAAKEAAIAQRLEAQVTLQQARSTYAEWRESAAARKRTADLTAQGTQLDNVSKLQTAVKAATPDLSNVARGELATPDDRVVFAEALKTAALENAADKVRVAVGRVQKHRLVITADSSLLQRDALRVGVQTQLESLTSILAAFPSPAPRAPMEPSALGVAGGVVTAALTATAQVVPGLLSLFAAHRKLTSQDLTVENEEALFAVAGSLVAAEPEARIVVDSFRFLGDAAGGLESPVLKARNTMQSALIDLQTKVAAEMAKSEGDQDKGWIAAANSLADSARDVLAALDSIPAGSSMSPLAAAMAVERLKLSDDNGIVFVQVAGASASVLTSDRASFLKDRVHGVATVSLTYALIDREDSHVKAAGVAAGHSQIVGRLGSTIDITRAVQSPLPLPRS